MNRLDPPDPSIVVYAKSFENPFEIVVRFERDRDLALVLRAQADLDLRGQALAKLVLDLLDMRSLLRFAARGWSFRRVLDFAHQAFNRVDRMSAGDDLLAQLSLLGGIGQTLEGLGVSHRDLRQADG